MYSFYHPLCSFGDHGIIFARYEIIYKLSKVLCSTSISGVSNKGVFNSQFFHSPTIKLLKKQSYKLEDSPSYRLKLQCLEDFINQKNIRYTVLLLY